MGAVKPYIKLMRVHHYIKNLLVFAALACSGQFFQGEKLWRGVAGFFAFSMVASAIYVINDIRDREKDRLHPAKRERPIASGAVCVKAAWVMAAALLALGGGCNALVFHPWASLLLAAYLVLNLAYSFGLKDIPLVDVSILVSGFLIRIIYGAIITDIQISNWLYLTVIAGAFYFALGKRRNELKRTGDGTTRKVLELYSPGFLDKNMYMCLALANVFYALWSVDDRTVVAHGNNDLIWTVPLVLLITMRYSMNIEGDSDGDPVEVLLHDKMLMALCGIYFLIMAVLLYL